MSETTEIQPWVPEHTGVLVIASDAQYVAVGERRQLLKSYMANVGEWFRGNAFKKGPLTLAHETWKDLLGKEQKALAPAEAEDAMLKAAQVAYDDTKAQLRAAETKRLQAQAAREEEDRRLAEALAFTEAAKHDPVLQEAADEAYALFDAPVETAAIQAPVQTPVVKGVTPSFRDGWKAREAVDIKKLAAGVASGKYPETYLKANMTALNAKARSCEGREKVDGVEFWNDRIPVQR